MAQYLDTFSVLVKDPGSVQITHMIVHNTLQFQFQGISYPLLVSSCFCINVVHTHKHAHVHVNIHIYIHQTNKKPQEGESCVSLEQIVFLVIYGHISFCSEQSEQLSKKVIMRIRNINEWSTLRNSQNSSKVRITSTSLLPVVVLNEKAMLNITGVIGLGFLLLW